MLKSEQVLVTWYGRYAVTCYWHWKDNRWCYLV